MNNDRDISPQEVEEMLKRLFDVAELLTKGRTKRQRAKKRTKIRRINTKVKLCSILKVKGI